MANYVEQLAEKKYIPNVIVRLKSQYFSIRQPDSGLTVPAANNGLLTQTNINPTSIDPFRATTTINNSSVTLLDKNGVISALFNNEAKFLQGELVEIWIGRCGVGMDFSEYFKLPDTYVNKVTKQENRYTFQSVEARDRLTTGAFQTATKLAVDIVAITTTITLQSTAGLPTQGTIKIDKEFISYDGILGNNIQNCVRGEEGSTPAAYNAGTDVALVQVLEGNPIDLILQLLVSPGGGSAYDVLPDGAGIDSALIDIDQFEEVRDEFFSGYQFKILVANLDSLKKLIEDELCFPLGIRLRGNNNSKIGLALIDRNIFEIDAPIIDHDQLTKNPDFTVDDTKVVNRVRILWDWSDAEQQYLRSNEYTDTDSIAEFGEKPFTELKFKGVRETLDGQEIVDAVAILFLNRFAFPRPQISVNTHLSASNLNLGDKADLITTLIPNDSGELNFASTLEVVSRAINYGTGDVKFALSFTSFSGVRQCYIAPSDVITSVTNQRTIGVGAGRGANYRKGWKMRLFSLLTDDYAPDAVNEIESVVGDTIIFKNNWSTTLASGDYRIKFADYDDVTDQQKRFCFISAGTNEFSDGRVPYQISFG